MPKTSRDYNKRYIGELLNDLKRADGNIERLKERYRTSPTAVDHLALLDAAKAMNDHTTETALLLEKIA